MSTNFGDVDLEHLTFPAIMAIDYVRVYQHPDRINVGCDPVGFPTAEYIKTFVPYILRCMCALTRLQLLGGLHKSQSDYLD